MSRQKTPRRSTQHASRAGKTGGRAAISTAAENISKLLVSSQPDGGAIDRLCAIPLLFDAPAGSRAYRGGVVIDSWSSGGAVALRDLVAGHTRRLQMSAGPIRLDLVAERRVGDWHFTARVKTGGSVAHQFALKVDARKLLPRSGGFYRWSSRAVPRSIELLSLDTRVVFERLAWE